MDRIAVHDYVEAPFEAVLGILEGAMVVPGVESRSGCHRVHHHMATLGISTELFDGTLRVFPIVGGLQTPTTELFLLVEGAGASATAARTLIDDLVRLLEKELHSNSVAG